MKKLVVSALAAAAVAASAFTLGAGAQDANEKSGPPRMGQAGFVFDAKVVGMKAELKLTPDQEKLWPAFEAAVREAHAARIEMAHERREGMEKGERPSPIAVMSEMSDHLAKASSELKKVADAAKPLYDSFDDTQKRQFGPLLLMLRQDGLQPWGHGDRGSQDSKPL